jgi:predicted phosphodiesterase
MHANISEKKTTYQRRLTNTAIYLLIFVIAWFVSSRFAATTYYIHDIGVNLDTEPAWQGTSIISLPPLGDIIASTHHAPLTLQLTLMRVNEGIFKTMQEEDPMKDPEKTIALLSHNISEAIGNYFLKLVGGVIGISSLLGWLIFYPRRLRQALISATVSTALVVSIFTTTLLTYNPNAFASARFDGLISQGASIFSAVNDALGGQGTLASKTYNLWGNLKGLAQEISGTTAGAGSEGGIAYKVLVVSDYHSNPVGVNFVVDLAKEIKPSLIVDCGDINDLGSSIETMSVSNLKKIKIPYVFIPGNHDGKATADFVRSMPQGIVLTNGIVEVEGFRIAGFADPYYAKKELDNPTKAGRHDLSKSEGLRISSWLAEKGPVDIVVTHRESIARLITTGGGIIFTGHTHKVNVFKNPAGIWVVNDGTTGAGGVRGLAADNPPPYSAAIVYFNIEKKAIATDIISFSPQSTSQAIDELGLPSGPSKVQMTRISLIEDSTNVSAPD